MYVSVPEMHSNNMESELLEKYQQRISEIQNVSDIIAISNLQLNKTLQKFGWSRQIFLKEKRLSQCCVTENHEVKEANLRNHIKVCKARKHSILDMKSKDFFTSPAYGYAHSTSVVPVFISERQYQQIGVKENIFLNTPDAKTCKQPMSNAESLCEANEDINQYSPCDSLDELRFIYSWKLIPNRYFTLNTQSVSTDALKEWLVENIHKMRPPASGIASGFFAAVLCKDVVFKLQEQDNFFSGHSIEVANAIISWMSTSQNADEIVNRLKGIFGSEANSFVLNLWKFITAKSLCTKQKIPEQTRNEFDFYGTALVSNSKCAEHKTTESDFKADDIDYPFLPMQWASYTLTRQQKLQIYEEVRKTGKLLTKPTVEFNELAAEAEEQMKVLAALSSSKKGEKTHLEVMAELRDYKRRRQSYRGKNKANRKMTGLEVLKEVVDQQMLYLEILQGKKNPENEIKKTASIVADTGEASIEESDISKQVPKDQVSDGQKTTSSRRRTKSRERRSKSEDRRSRDSYRRSKSRERKKNNDNERHHRRNTSRNRSRSQERRLRSRSRSPERRHRSRSRNHERRRSKGSRETSADNRSISSTNKKVVSNITYY